MDFIRTAFGGSWFWVAWETARSPGCVSWAAAWTGCVADRFCWLINVGGDSGLALRPGNKFAVCDPMTTFPADAVKTGIKLSLRGSPPTASHGIQTLYDAPRSDSL